MSTVETEFLAGIFTLQLALQTRNEPCTMSTLHIVLLNIAICAHFPYPCHWIMSWFGLRLERRHLPGDQNPSPLDETGLGCCRARKLGLEITRWHLK